VEGELDALECNDCNCPMKRFDGPTCIFVLVDEDWGTKVCALLVREQMIYGGISHGNQG
jgi:hypothetical protein